MGGTTTWQGMGISVPSLAPNGSALFPGACKLLNGDVIMTVPRMTNHLYGDGELWKQTGTDNGNGTVTWRNDWVKIYARKGDSWDVRGGLCSRVPSGVHAGKIVVAVSDTNWLASRLNIDYLSPWPTVSVQCFCRILISTDTTATSFVELSTLPPAFPAIAPNCNDFPECPVVFVPNESGGHDWMVATYSRETHDYIGWYSSAYFRSVDQGASFTHEGFVARANTANTDQATAQQCDEPQLLQLANGEMLCVIRWLDEGRNPDGSDGYHHKLFRCSNPTDIGGMVWVAEGDCTATPAGSRPALLQHSNGMVIHGYRGVVGGFSVQGIYRSSNDNGHTWGTERNLDNGNVTTGNSGTGIYSYGAWVELSGGALVHEYSQDNSPATNSVVRETRLSVVSTSISASITPATETDSAQALSYGLVSAGLTLDPDGFWDQVGTAITVRAAVGRRREVTGVVSSTLGGVCAYHGVSADEFELSLNGSDWAPTITVPSGDTPVWLAAVPSSTGLLTAQISTPA